MSLLLMLRSPRSRELGLAALIITGAALWVRELARYGDTQALTVCGISAGIGLAVRWAAVTALRAIAETIRVRGGHG